MNTSLAETKVVQVRRSTMLSFPQINLIQHNTPSGRFYETPDGDFFPSITTVLGSIPNPEIDAWRQSIGEEKAKQISEAATKRGTKFHTYCEEFILGKHPKLDIFDTSSYSSINGHLSKIRHIAIEAPAYSTKLRVAGTFDCLGYYDDQLCLIDFKTTNKLKHDGEFDSYYMQTAAYAMMVYERSGIMVPNLLILMQNWKDGETYVYRSKTAEWLPRFCAVRNAFKDQCPLLPGT